MFLCVSLVGVSWVFVCVYVFDCLFMLICVVFYACVNVSTRMFAFNSSLWLIYQLFVFPACVCVSVSSTCVSVLVCVRLDKCLRRGGGEREGRGRGGGVSGP